MSRFAPDTIAMGAVALAGLAWGVFWVPLRALEAAGITGAWAVLVFQALPTFLLLPVYVLRRRRLCAGGWSLHLAGLFAGTALVCYAGALIFTDIVRALLFYYLTPIWSTLLARVVLGEKIDAIRWGTILLGGLGLALIIRVENGLGQAFNIGDLMGVCAGLIWAVAAVSMKADQKNHGLDLTLSYFFWGTLAAGVLVLVPISGPAPDPSAVSDTLFWLVPTMLVLVFPATLAVIWGATLISPGLLAILFMTEISAGTITAALWAGEPVGVREIAGVLLISAAGLWEPVFRAMRRHRR